VSGGGGGGGGWGGGVGSKCEAREKDVQSMQDNLLRNVQLLNVLNAYIHVQT